MLTAISTEGECRRALTAAFPVLNITDLRYLAEGWDSTAFAVNGIHVFRFPKRAGVDATVQKEIRLLPQLSPVLPTAIPEFDHVSGPTAAFAWHIVGYPLIHGTPADDTAAVANNDRIAPAVSAVLRALHTFPVDRARNLCVPEFTPASWLDRHAALFGRARDIARPLVPDAIWTAFVSDWTAMLAVPGWFEFAPTLVHGDLAMEHLMADASGALAGIIDFGEAMIADPALDFAGFPVALAERILSDYTVDPAIRSAFLARRSIYANAAPLHALTAGQHLGREDLVRAGIHRLTQMYG